MAIATPVPLLGLALLAAVVDGSDTPVPIAPRSWSVVGPYPSCDPGDLARPFPPEQVRNFARAVPGAGTDAWLAWSAAPAGERLLLPALPAGEGPSIAYAVTYIETPTAGRARLAIASPGSWRAWMDRVAVDAGAEAAVTVELTPGLHELLVKQRSPGAAPLQAVIAGPAGLRFLPQPPWPLRPLPAGLWRSARTADAGAADAARAAVTAAGIGLPELAGCSWDALPSTAGGVRCQGAMLLASHIFFPLKYHLQDYRLRCDGVRPAAVWLDGRRLAAEPGAAGTACYSFSSSLLRPGFNRLVVELPASADGMLAVALSDPGDLKYAAEPPAATHPDTLATTWPEATISNGLVTARLALPDDDRGLYRGNRFERAGLVAHLEYRGHTYFLGPPGNARPLDSWVCYGPAEEWFEALAWHDAEPGEPFLKMGVGLFERPAHPRHMWYCAYWPLAFLPWTGRIAGNAAEFTQVCDGPRGWGYRYTKRLVLEPGRPVLRIEHELANTGRHPIAGEQYNHNFLVLDGRPPQTGYRCDLAFAPRPSKDIGGWARIDGRSVVLTSAPEGQVGCELAGWSDPVADQGFTVSCAGTTAAVAVGGDAPLARLAFFASPGYLAVEPFVRIEAAAGTTARWTRTYTFSGE